MKLAEALIERADLQSRIAQLKTRMINNVKVQEGDEPAEIVDDLLAEYETLMSSLEGLIIRINKTNSETMIDKQTLSQAITRRDNLKGKMKFYRDLYEAGSISPERYRGSEIRFVRSTDLKQLQARIDALSAEYRKLDTKMQGLNWTADLLE